MHPSSLRPTQRSEEGAPTEMSLDPVKTNPQHYRVVFENDRVRVLEYTDRPGDRTTPHAHPDSVMITLSSYRRRLQAGNRRRDVELTEGATRWLPAQHHAGENIGDTPTHAVFVELKGTPLAPGGSYLGPDQEPLDSDA
ncbi:MAG: cupin domain-containing protein [Pseudonocardiaceae bacterium]